MQLHLLNSLPGHPTIDLHDFAPVQLYPAPPSHAFTSTSPSGDAQSAFSTCHRFSVPLPSYLASQPSFASASTSAHPSSSPALPGTLNLSSSHRGEVRWSLEAKLSLTSSGDIIETVPVEGTPQDVFFTSDEPANEVEQSLDQDGVKARLLVDNDSPRLGALLRLGVEVRAKEREKTGVAGLSTQPDPAKTLRRLRRVRVQLFRRVQIHGSSSTTQFTSASTSSPNGSSTEQPGMSHLSLLHQSGKVLRHPGLSRSHPPLRVLFTLPTVQLGATADQSWGEISQSTIYHSVEFFVRVGVGFVGGEGQDAADWTLEQPITIRPKIWREPTVVVVERGLVPALGMDGEAVAGPAGGEGQVSMSEEEMAREAYRRKGLDTVGSQGTYRASEGVDGGGEDMPPAWDAGPSHSDLHSIANGEPLATQPGIPVEARGVSRGQEGALPSFLESEAQMASGEAPFPKERVMSERLIPVDFDTEGGVGQVVEEDGATMVGRSGSLGGELGTWVEVS